MSYIGRSIAAVLILGATGSLSISDTIALAQAPPIREPSTGIFFDGWLRPPSFSKLPATEQAALKVWQLAEDATKTGDKTKAEKLCRELIYEHPTTVARLLAMGEMTSIATDNDDAETARTRFKKLVDEAKQLQSEQPTAVKNVLHETCVRLAKNQCNRGEYEAALTYCRLSLTKYPMHGSYCGEGYFRLQSELIRLQHDLEERIRKRTFRPVPEDVERINRLAERDDARLRRVLSRARCLDIEQSKVNAIGWDALRQFPNLHGIRLSSADFSDVLLAELSKSPQIDALTLTGEADAKEFDRISRLSNLRELDLSNAKVTPGFAGMLAKLSALSKLNLAGVPLTAAEVASIAQIKTLSDLNLSNTTILEDSLPEINQLRELTSLNLSENVLRNSGISRLMNLNKLRELRIRNTLVAREGLQVLEKMPELRILDLSNNGVTNEDLNNYLPVAKNLENLVLSGTYVIDGLDGTLRSLPRLREVSLINTRITPAGLAGILSHDPIVKVRISFPSEGDKEAIESRRKEFPLKAICFPGEP